MKAWARGPLLPVLSVGVLVAALCALLLHERRKRVRNDSPMDCIPMPESWADVKQSGAPFGLNAPVPRTPFPGQQHPPCIPRTETEINGGCWVKHAELPPCPPSTYEHEGRCWMPSIARAPTPVAGPQ